MKCPLQLVTNITIMIIWPCTLVQTHSVDKMQSIVLYAKAFRLSSQNTKMVCEHDVKKEW